MHFLYQTIYAHKKNVAVGQVNAPPPLIFKKCFPRIREKVKCRLRPGGKLTIADISRHSDRMSH